MERRSIHFVDMPGPSSAGDDRSSQPAGQGILAYLDYNTLSSAESLFLDVLSLFHAIAEA